MSKETKTNLTFNFGGLTSILIIILLILKVTNTVTWSWWVISGLMILSWILPILLFLIGWLLLMFIYVFLETRKKY